MLRTLILAALMLIATVVSNAVAQPPSAEALKAQQRKALAPLESMRGTWRGTAWRMTPQGKRVEFTQTERVGAMLDETIQVVEGAGWDSAGKRIFHAFATMALDPSTGKLQMHSHAEGRVGDFEIKLTESGFTWEYAAGPMTIHYVATVADDRWHEYGERILEGRDPIRFMEMNLKRIGDTKWPAEGAISPQE